MAIYDPIVDLFSQDQVKAPNIDESAADLGRNEDYAVQQNSYLAQQGQQALANRQQQSNAQEAMGATAVAQGNQRADTFGAAGQAGQVAGQVRGTMLDRTGMDMGAGARAQAGALQGDAQAAQGRAAPNVNLAAANQSAATGTQAQAGLMSNASALGAAAGANKAQGQVAGALGTNAGALGGNAASLAAMAKTPAAQAANAQALGAAGQTTAEQQGNAAALRGFYQSGPGPSVAEAQLRQGGEAAMASNLAMARSGRGGANAGAERQALFANAAQQQQLNQGQAILRAQETDAFRNRQLQAMGLETGALGTARGQDIQGLTAQTGALGQARGQDIGAMTAATGALGQQTNALAQQGNVVGQSRGQDLQALGLQTGALGQAGSLANQQQQIGAQTALGVSGQQLQQRGMNDAASIQREQLAQQALQAGNQNQLAAMGMGTQSIGQGQQFALGMGGLGNQSVATGQGTNVALQGLANQASQQGYQNDLAYMGMGNQLLTNQANLDMNMEALKSGQMLQASMANAGYDQARDASVAGMAMGVAGLLSDIRAKEAIGMPGDDDPYGLSGGGMSQPGVAASPMASTTPTGPGGPAYDQAMKSAAEAQTAEAASASSPQTAGLMQMAGQLLGGGANIPTYQAPQFTPIDANYVTSDEKAKEAAEDAGFERGLATARINAVHGLNAYEARGKLPQYIQYLREQAMEDMRKHGVKRESTEVEIGPAEDVRPVKAKPKPKVDPKKSAAMGLVVPGTIKDLTGRKRLKNPDGSVSTLSSMSFEENGREILVPTVVDGKRLSEEEAIRRYHSTGQHLGIFDTPQNATDYAKRLHEDQARETDGPTSRAESRARAGKMAAMGIPDGETDLRAAQNSTWQYKDPSQPGAVPGRQVGPMAQDLLKTDAAPLVRQQPNGMLAVDGPRSGLVALGAVGEQQRRTDELERRLAALGVRSAA